MNEKQLYKSINEIKPTVEQKERMLGKLLQEVEQKEKVQNVVPFKKVNKNRWVALAASMLIVAGVGISTQQVQNQAMIETPGYQSPEQMRQFMNYNGYRYAFNQELDSLNVQEDQLIQPLGELRYQINESHLEYSTKDLATTYGLGGMIWEIKGYSPMFRVAVEIDGIYYIYENVGPSDNKAVELGTLLEAMQIDEKIEFIEVSVLGTDRALWEVNKEQSRALFDEIKKSEFIDPATIDFEKLYTQDIRSMKLVLDDQTEVTIVVNPEEKIMIFGDNYYEINNELKTLLKQE